MGILLKPVSVPFYVLAFFSSPRLLMFPSGRVRSIIYGKNLIPLPSVKKVTALQGFVMVTKVAVLFTGLAV